MNWLGGDNYATVCERKSHSSDLWDLKIYLRTTMLFFPPAMGWSVVSICRQMACSADCLDGVTFAGEVGDC